MIEAITLDFGNTLVPVSAAGLRGVVADTASAMAQSLGPFDADELLRAWAEERERQFREEVPQFREVDLAQRLSRILARLRGMPPPPPDTRWDDVARPRSAIPPRWPGPWTSTRGGRGLPAARPGGPALLARLAPRYRLAILSNWPLAATIDRYVEAAAGRHTSRPWWCASGSGPSSRTRRSSPRPGRRSVTRRRLDPPRG